MNEGQYIKQPDGRYKGPDGRYYVKGQIDKHGINWIDVTTIQDDVPPRRDDDRPDFLKRTR